MKITNVRTSICHAYRTNWVFVHLETDQGITGIGEATLEMREQTVCTAIDELNRYLVGRDPMRIDELWHEVYRDAYWRGGPVLMSALSGVEMAMHDIKGKVLNVPVWQLLGGQLRSEVPCYANGWFVPAKTPDEFATKAREAVAAGFQGLKWDPFGSSYLNITKPQLCSAIECVEAVVDAVGTQVDILIEGHGRFNLPSAIRIGRELEKFDITWFEEPVPPDNLEALAQVRRQVRVPIAAGERLYSRFEVRRFLDLGCADFIQPDVSHCGGVGELRRIAAMAETHHVAVCPHNPSGPVANAATLQVAASAPNFFLLETMFSDVPHRREVTDEAVGFKDGQMSIPDGPGLGITVHEVELAKHPYQPRNLRHYRGDLTDIRPADAVSYFQSEPDSPN